MPKYIKNIKLVIFDVNETMFSLANINYLFKNFGLPPNTSDLWFANVLKEGFACSSHGSFCTFIDIGANELKKLFLKFELKYKKTHFNMLLNELSNLNIHHDVAESIKILHKYGLKIVTLTNGSKSNTLKLIKKNNMSKYINRCFSIDEIKLWKPNKKIYLHVCNEMSFSPSDAMMIAAHAWDVSGAKNAGLKTAYITRYEKILGSIYPKPDIVAQDCLSVINRIKFN